MPTYRVKERQTIIVAYIVDAVDALHARDLVNALSCTEYDHFVECVDSDVTTIEQTEDARGN